MRHEWIARESRAKGKGSGVVISLNDHSRDSVKHKIYASP